MAGKTDFNGIIDGLGEAIAHAKGVPTPGTVIHEFSTEGVRVKTTATIHPLIIGDVSGKFGSDA